jgi:hypothetical protein
MQSKRNIVKESDCPKQFSTHILEQDGCLALPTILQSENTKKITFMKTSSDKLLNNNRRIGYHEF